MRNMHCSLMLCENAECTTCWIQNYIAYYNDRL